MGTFTAQQLLDENNWTTSDISLANTEYLVNNAIHHIELETGLSLNDMTSQSVTVTDGQETVIKALSALMIRAHLDRGPQVGVAGLSVTAVIADPQYSLFTKILEDGINRLRGRSFKRT